MLNENPGKSNWKNKLEQGQGLAGEMLADKNATWEKLHHRLQSKRRKIKPVWYWAAAACLLIAMMIPLLTPTKKQPDLVKAQSPPPLQTNQYVAKIIPIQELQEVAVASTATEKKITKTIGIYPKKESQRAANISETVSIITTTVSTPNATELLKTMEQPQVQDMPAVKAIASLGNIQKLKVVHVNELGDPVPETHSRNIVDYRTVQIKLINQEVYTKASTSSSGFNFFKTTNAPSN